MYTRVITFDEILHFHRNAATRSSPKHTVFSFMSEFKYTAYVTAPGFPRLEPGMRVLAVLRSQDEWKALVGWRDLDTGELVAPDASWHLKRLAFLAAWALLCVLLFGQSLRQAEHPYQWLIALFAILWSVVSYIEFRSWRQAQLEATYMNDLAPPNAA